MPDCLPICFSTLSCPDWTWQEILQRGPEYGYDGVEIRLIARETDLLKVPELQRPQLETRRQELSAAGLKVCGLASSVRFDETESAQRSAQLAIGRAYVDLAVELESSFVRVFGDVLPPVEDQSKRDAALSWIADGLDQLGEYAARNRIEIMLETHGDFCESPAARAVMSRVTSPAVGILWDTHHPWRFHQEPVEKTFENLQPWVRHTHWKDSSVRKTRQINAETEAAAAAAQALMTGHKHADYVLFGEGEFPTAKCLKLLIGAGYTGWLSLEWEKMWHPEIEGPELAMPPFPRVMRQLWREMGE